MPVNLKKLQKLIDKAVAAHTDAHIAQTALDQYTIEVYGVTSGDVDADSIIDAVEGGCGVPNGMDARDYDRIMCKLVEK